VIRIALMACFLGVACLACQSPDREVLASAARLTGGDPGRGRFLLRDLGCGACHLVTRVPGARGTIGPPLDSLAGRSTIAGRLENSPQNLRHFLMEPQSVLPGSAMPDLGIRDEQARDLSAFLYTLR
jgi:cytochrome c